MNTRLSELYGEDAHYLVLDGPVTREKTEEIWNDVFEKFKDNPDRAFVLTITTSGGEFMTAYNFYMKIKYWGVKLVTVALGSVSSAGVILCLAGQERLAHRGALFVIHDLSTEIENASLHEEDLLRLAAILRKTRLMLYQLLKQHLKVTGRRLKSLLTQRTEPFLDTEARNLGIIHKIID